MRLRLLLPVVAIAALAALLLSGPGEAVSRQRAVAAALAALKPQRAKGAVVVYGLPAALPAGTVVQEAGPTGAIKLAGNSSFQGPVRSWKLTGKAWLFWEDLFPGAGFVHPSRLLLVDDATGRVKISALLSWWPLVGGKPAAFLAHANDRRYVVFDNTAGTGKTSAYRRPAGALRPAAPRFTGEQDCFVYSADLASGTNEDGYFQSDAAAMNAWADSHHLAKGPGNADSAAALAAQIKQLTDAGCNDVVVVLIGHGVPKPGQQITLPNGTRVTATVGSDVAAVEVSSNGAGKSFVTSKDIADIVKGYQIPNPEGKPVSLAHFKLIVSSCFGGRFIDDLAPLQASDANNPDPPIRTIVTSSSSALPTALGQKGGPIQKSYWITSFLDGFTRIENNPNVTGADQGDLASLITDAANSADDAAQRGHTRADRLLRYNHSQAHFSAGTLHPHGEGREPVPPGELDVRPIQAFFTSNLRHTTYSIFAKPDPIAYQWVLVPPASDPRCNNRGQLSSTAATFTWYHGDDAPCSHGDEDQWGHRGVVFVKLWLPGYVCTASIYGTVTGNANDPGRPSGNDSCKPG